LLWSHFHLMFHASSTPNYWLKNTFSSYFCIKIAHYNFCIMGGILWYIWLSLSLYIYIYIYISITKITIKLLNYPLILTEHTLSSAASKFITACLYFLLIRKLIPKVLLLLPLFINMMFPVSNTPFPLHLISWIASISILYFSSSLLQQYTSICIFSRPPVIYCLFDGLL